MLPPHPSPPSVPTSQLSLTLLNASLAVPPPSLDLSSNAISGRIPPDLQYLVNLAVLNLSSNRLDGPIPSQLAMCAYLNVIDLHQNLLTAQIPQQLGLLVRLSAFDVSNNRLSGPIPGSLGNRTRNLPRFNQSSFEGNKDLYGYPLPPYKSKGLSILDIVGIGLGSGLASLILSFAGVCIWLKLTEQKMDTEEGTISNLMPGAVVWRVEWRRKVSGWWRGGGIMTGARELSEGEEEEEDRGICGGSEIEGTVEGGGWV